MGKISPLISGYSDSCDLSHFRCYGFGDCSLRELAS